MVDFRIAHPLDAVAAVAVKTLGRVGVAQRVHLSVVGFGVGLQAFGVAAAAVPGDRQLGRVLRRIFDVVGGMAIRADRRHRVLVVQHCLAVHRRRVLLAFLGVALAARVRNAQPPLRAFGAAFGVDVVRRVAVVAGCVGARLVFPVRPRVDGFHVVVDLLHHHPEPRVLLGLVLRLGGVPQGFVAADATDLVRHAGLVRNFGDVGVALDAKPLAVHALSELVLDHVQRAHLPVRAGGRKPCVAVTAQAGFVVEPARGGRIRGMGLRLPQQGRAGEAQGRRHQPRRDC